MISNELKNKIEDVFVHFEDVKYTIDIRQYFSISSGKDNIVSTDNVISSTNRIYDCIKCLADISPNLGNSILQISENISVSLMSNSPSTIKKYDDWNWFNTTLNTAIKRLPFDNTSDVKIGLESYKTEISILKSSFKYQNLYLLGVLCRSFNKKWEGECTITPEFNPDNGIDIVVRVVPRGISTPILRFEGSTDFQIDLEKYFDYIEIYKGKYNLERHWTDKNYSNTSMDPNLASSKIIVAKIKPKKFVIEV